MSIITVSIAESISNQMTYTLSEEIKTLKTQLKQVAEEIYLNHLPIDLVKCFRKYPEYFNRSSNHQFIAPGLDYEYFYFTKSLPYQSHTTEIEVKEANVLLDLSEIIKAKEKHCEKIKRDIKTALINIKTYNKCLTMFPEAFPFLPKKTTTAVTINLSGIRSALFSN